MGMKWSLSKTEFIVVGKPSMSLVVNNIAIDSVNTMKMLVTYIDIALKWDTYTQKQLVILVPSKIPKKTTQLLRI